MTKSRFVRMRDPLVEADLAQNPLHRSRMKHEAPRAKQPSLADSYTELQSRERICYETSRTYDPITDTYSARFASRPRTRADCTLTAITIAKLNAKKESKDAE